MPYAKSLAVSQAFDDRSPRTFATSALTPHHSQCEASLEGLAQR